MRKFKYQVFSRKSVYRGVSEIFNKIPVSEGDMHNFRKFRIFCDLPELKRMENDRMHSGTDGRTDILQIIILEG